METALCRASADNRLRNLSDLVARPDDGVALVILDHVNLLVLFLGALPDLDLATTPDNTDPHGGEQVVGCV